MSAQRIAIRYATPLLDLSIEQKVEDKVKSDLDSFIELCESNRDFLLMLNSPVIPHLRKAGIVKKIFQGKVNELTMKFFDITIRKNRENVLYEIAQEFISLFNQKKGLQKATLTTAVAVDAKLKKEFEGLVKSLTGKSPVLEEKVNSEIIGGYELTIGDKRLDASVSGQLRSLKLKFSKEKN